MKVRYHIERLKNKVVFRLRIGKFTLTLELPP